MQQTKTTKSAERLPSIYSATLSTGLSQMATNSTRNKHFDRARANKQTLWAYFDAQPQHVREWFHSFPANVWPSSHLDHTNLISDAEARHLAGLEAIWGPDHPAVIDARQRVHVKRGKIQQVADLSALDDFDF